MNVANPSPKRSRGRPRKLVTPAVDPEVSEDDIEPLLLPIWPHAGRVLGYRSKGAAYDAVNRGDVFVVALGKKIRRVPKWWLDRKISGEMM